MAIGVTWGCDGGSLGQLVQISAEKVELQLLACLLLSSPSFVFSLEPTPGFVPPTLRECLLSSASQGPPWQTHPGIFVLIKLVLDEPPHRPADRSLTYNFNPGIPLPCVCVGGARGARNYESQPPVREKCAGPPKHTTLKPNSLYHRSSQSRKPEASKATWAASFSRCVWTELPWALKGTERRRAPVPPACYSSFHRGEVS